MLKNKQFWQFFENSDSSEYVIQFSICLDPIPVKNITSIEYISNWKIAKFVAISGAFSSTKPQAVKYIVPFKSCF